MNLLRNAIDRFLQVCTAVAQAEASSPRPYSFTRDYCPHCEENTEWKVSVLHRFYLCTACQRNPKLAPDADREVAPA